MPLFTEDIHDDSHLPGTPVQPSAYTGPVQTPAIPSYFQPWDSGQATKALSYEDMVRGSESSKVTSDTPLNQVSSSTLLAGKRYEMYRPNVDYEDIYSQAQSGWDRVANASVQFGNKVGAYLTQTAGFIAGAIPAAIGGITNMIDEGINGGKGLVNNGNAVSYMTDNFLTNLGDLWKEKVQEENPIYKSYKYTHGNIWDKLASSSWWLDDAVDRLALTASMIIPGVAEAKGIGLFGAAVDAAGTLEATGMGAKALQALADNPELYGKLGKMMGNQLYKSAVDGTADIIASRALAFKNMVGTAQKLELYSWNVIGQSALNGREAQVGIRRALHEQREAGLSNLTEEEIDDKAALGAAKGFWYTVPLALTASLVELPQIFSTAKTATSSLKKFFNPETLKVIEGVAEKSSKLPIFSVKGNSIITKMLYTGLEHGQNESAQVAVGRYLEESIAGKIDHGKVIKDDQNPFISIAKNWADNVNDPNGQNNIALGTIQGMLMTVGGHAKSVMTGEYTKEVAANKRFIDKVNQAVSDRRIFATPENFIEKDEQGKIKLHPDGTPVFNQQKLAQLGMTTVGAAESYQKRLDAIKNNDQLSLEELNFKSLSALSQNFFDDPKGIEYLTNLLRFEAKNQSENINRVNDSTAGVEITPEYQLQENIGHIKNLKRAYDAIENRHAGFTALEISQSDETEMKLRANYINKMSNAQYQNAATQLFINNKIAKNNVELGDLGISEYNEDVKTPEQDRANTVIKENEQLAQRLDTVKDSYKELIDKDKFKEGFTQDVSDYKSILAKIEAAKAAVAAGTNVATTPGVQTVNIKTKDGEEDIEIGTEYYLGKRVFKDKDGNDVYTFPRLTVLGENPDGSIKIKGSDGIERDVSKDELLNYKLGKVSDVAANKTANYYLQHINDVFTYNFGKKFGGKIAGRLEYHSKENKLFFVYKDLAGKVKYKEVDNAHFAPQEGYTEARINKVRTFQIETAEQKQAAAEFTSKEELQKAEDRLEQRLSERRRIIKEVSDETKAHIERIDKKIVSRKEKLAKLNEELNELGAFRVKDKYSNVSIVTNFNKVLSRSMKGLTELTGLKNSLEKEIEELQSEKEELEFNVSYFEDFMQNLKELPEKFYDMVNELTDQVKGLEDLALSAGQQINQFSKMIDDINATIKDFSALIQTAFEKFNKDYPQDLKDKFESIRKSTTVQYNDIVELKDFMSDFSFLEDFKKEISLSKDQVKNLTDKIDGLYNNLTEIGKEQVAKEAILDAFKVALAKELEKKKQEEVMRKNIELMKEVMGTMNQSVQNRQFDREFEPDPKKDDKAVVKSTTFPTTKSTGGLPIPEHYQRANRFGNRMSVPFANRSLVQGVVVTSQTESKLIPGLANFLKQGKEGIDSTTTISLVMAIPDETGKGYTLIDENGDAIAPKGVDETQEAYEDRLHNSAIFQPFPITLDGMWRDSTETATKEALTKQYNAWRTEALANKDLSSYKIQASFGIADKIQKVDEKGNSVDDFDAPGVSVASSGLIKEGQLGTEPLITIPKTDGSVSLGSTSFKDALGATFLMVKNALVKLNNRKHTTEEANTIYQVIRQLADNLAKGKTIKESAESQRLVEWLRTVVYWGSPGEKNPGYNSVWFDDSKGGFKLFMSGKVDENGNYTDICDFGATAIEESKERIISILQNMYNNTNSKLTGDETEYNKRYEQILSITPEGEVKSIIWPNYQTYLLSDKMPNENGEMTLSRKAREIPLTTRIRPLENAQDVNRKGIYFTINDKDFDKFFTDIAPTGAAVTILTPGAPKATSVTAPVTKTVTPAGQFTLDGATPNVIEVIGADGTSYGKTSFILDSKKYIETDGAQGFTPTFEGSVVEALGKAKGTDNETTQATIAKYIMSKVYPQIQAEMKAAETPAPVVAPPADTTGMIGLFSGGVGDTFWTSALDSLKNGKASEAIFKDAIQLYKDGKIKTIDDLKTYYEDKKAGRVPFSEAPVSDAQARKNKAIASIEKVADGWRTVADDQGGKSADELIADTKEELLKLIDDKYKDELTTLEQPVQATEEVPSVNEQLKAQLEADKKETVDNPELRVKLEKEINDFEGENWDKVEAYLKANFPNVPFYRVKNILRGANGLQAWGMVQDGAIYVYENAEVGTAYHEIFEAVWKMMTSEKEQEAVRSEFRNRKGSFVDRVTGTITKYSEANDKDLKEQLAEEFRDFVQNGTKPPSSKDGKSFIAKMFSELVAIIKSLFLGKSRLTPEKMFKNISKGKYKAIVPNESALSYAKAGIQDVADVFVKSGSELSEIPGFTQTQVHEIMQQMTYLTLGYFQRDNQSLFNISKLNKEETYGKIQKNIRVTLANMITEVEGMRDRKEISNEAAEAKIAPIQSIYNNVILKWDSLLETHEDFLKKYDVEFDENDDMGMKNEDKTGKGEYDGADKIDHFRKLNSAVKLVLSTLPILDNNKKPKLSSIGGVQLVPTGEAWIAVMNNLSTATGVDSMIEQIRQMAKDDTNYETLYKRLAKTSSDNKIDWDQLQKHDLQLVTAFGTAFDKQNPDVKIFNIFQGGDVQISESNFNTAARQVKANFVDGMKQVFHDAKNAYFQYDDKQKAYVAKPDVVKNLDLASIESKVKFLNSIGIQFTTDEIKNLEVDDAYSFRKFNDSVTGIRSSMEARNKLFTFGGKVLQIEGRLLTLSNIKAKIDNPEFSSTFYGVNGEKIQTFIGTNPSSEIYKALSALPNYESLNGHKKYGYLYSDSFSQNSVLLNSIFNIDKKTKTGDRRTVGESRQFLKPGIADGMNDQSKGKKKQSAKLNYKERMLQEINMNLDGWYYNLVAGDASMEHMMYMGNYINKDDVARGFDVLHNVFRGYLIDEINLSREEFRTVSKDRDAKELRFFKDILGSELSKKITDNKSDSPETIYDNNKPAIDRAVEKFIKDKTESFKEDLMKYNIIEKGLEKDTFTATNLAFAKNDKVSKEILDNNLLTLTSNFIINNIEFHKVLYSDPYQYSDELKRIKNFLSPRQSVMSGSAYMNSSFNRVWNEGFKEDDVAITNFNQDYFRSATLSDIKGLSFLKDYETFEETDGTGIISMKANRNFRIRSGKWSDANEDQYRYDTAWENRDKGKDLSPREKEILKKGNPGIQDTYTPLKPIVAGSKLNAQGGPSSFNNIMLDKFALFVSSYRVMKEINKDATAIKFYDKMQKENLDYVVFGSARKVGAEGLNEVYNPVDGSFNDKAYDGVINVPFSIMSIQSEVPSKEDAFVTRGSQMTKLITMDYMEAGVPIDFEHGENKSTAFSTERYQEWYNLTDEQREEKSPLYKEIKNNQNLLESLMEEGYQTFLKRLGIAETKGEDGKSKFEITDFSETGKTLREEMLKREVNDNILQALKGFINGDVTLEATPAYQQVRNILYSLADKNIISPKISGRQSVQMTSAMLESVKAKETEINGKKGYTSDTLDFYSRQEDGKTVNVCELMVARWFPSNKTDEQLLEYFNNTEEGKKELAILAGVAFRTPTQKQNSIEVFKIKKFLPKEFGDAVIVPSELVRKVGSDFDIDKLSIYLKNVYQDNKGNIKLIPFLGRGEAGKAKFEEMYNKGELDGYIKSKKDSLLLDTPENKLFREIFPDEFLEEKSEVINNLYKKSLENAYIQSCENLVSHELNYDQLIKPNDATLLKDLSKKITEKRGDVPFNYKSVGNMLDRTFMTSLRHAFVTGKYAIGIAAIAQTNHSLNQRQPVYIDVSRFSKLDKVDQYWLTGGTMKAEDAAIKFNKFNQITVDGRQVATLSMIKSADGKEFISDINGMFIDGYVDISKGPWIMELGATPSVASTFLLLNKLGVPIEDVSYFMNQPIVRDYLQSLENSGYSYLFIDKYVDALKDSSKYKVADGQLAKIETIPGKTKLFESIGKDKFTPQEKAEQQFILDEFLKYAKMAEHLLTVTQGTNFDTAALNDPYLVFKKMEQLKKAENTIISSSTDLLANSFVGQLGNTVGKVREALAEILKSDQNATRQVMENVLREYTSLSDRDFLKVAQKGVSDFFDWAVQLDKNRNTFIESLLLSDQNAAKQITDFKNTIAKDPSHPLYDNYIVGVKGILEVKPSDKLGGVNNISVKNKDNKVYDQDQVIYSFRELRNYLKSTNSIGLYKSLVGASVLQSGLSTTTYSFTSLIPYEDFKEVYNDVISNLENRKDINLMDFHNLSVFQRNNWANDDIVPQEKARVAYSSMTGEPLYNLNMQFRDGKLNKAMDKGEIPRLLKLSTRSNSSDNDVVSYTWISVPKGKTQTQMMKDGDYSYIQRGLFKKVYFDEARTRPVVDGQGTKYENYVYQMINAWGDSFRANEFYNTTRTSVIDNGFIKVEQGSFLRESNVGFTKRAMEEIFTSPERSDPSVNKFFSEGTPAPVAKQIVPKNVVSSQDMGGKAKIAMQPFNIEKIKSGEKTTTTRSDREFENIGIPVGQSAIVNFGGQDFTVTNRGLLSIEEAGGKEVMLKSEGYKSVENLLYQQTKDWMSGKGKVYIYDIKPKQDMGRQAEIEPGYGLTAANFEDSTEIDNALNQKEQESKNCNG